MLLGDGAEHPIPVGSTKVRRSSKGRYRVLLGAYVLHNDIVHVVLLDLRSQVDIDFNAVLSILLFDGLEEGVEPFGTTEVTDNPGEVDLAES